MNTKEFTKQKHQNIFYEVFDTLSDMTYEDVRDYERMMQSKTNNKVVGNDETESRNEK